VEWLKAESRDHPNFRLISTLVDAILHTLEAAPKPLPTELVLKLLTELRENTVTRYYFPFDQFLSILTAIRLQTKFVQNSADFTHNMLQFNRENR